MLTGAQKALALPPGFSLFSVSEKAFTRAGKDRIADIISISWSSRSEQTQYMTPSTPSIGHVHALEFKLDEIFQEGLEARYARHARTNALVHDWVRRAGIRFFRRGRVPHEDADLREKQ